MKYSDIYRLYSTSQPKDAIHQALREVPVDDSDEQYEDRSPLHLACQYGDTEGVKILLERDAEPNTKDANGSTPSPAVFRLLAFGASAAGETVSSAAAA